MAQQEKDKLFMPAPVKEDLRPIEQRLPHSLDIIHEFLDQVHAPVEPFDPSGEWQHSYRILVALRGGYDKSYAVGAFKIARRLSSFDSVELTITKSLKTEWYVATQNTQARSVCASDQLATPRKWEIQSVQLDDHQKPVNYSRISISGSADGRTIHSDSGKRTFKLGKHFTSNWSLFDAVQRLSFEGEPIEFDLLEEMDKPRRAHRLFYSGSIETELGGKPTKLHSFTHLGEGILPTTYWLDDKHRLLMAICGLVTYLFDPEASLVEEVDD